MLRGHLLDTVSSMTITSAIPDRITLLNSVKTRSAMQPNIIVSYRRTRTSANVQGSPDLSKIKQTVFHAHVLNSLLELSKGPDDARLAVALNPSFKIQATSLPVWGRHNLFRGRVGVHKL